MGRRGGVVRCRWRQRQQWPCGHTGAGAEEWAQDGVAGEVDPEREEREERPELLGEGARKGQGHGEDGEDVAERHSPREDTRFTGGEAEVDGEGGRVGAWKGAQVEDAPERDGYGEGNVRVEQDDKRGAGGVVSVVWFWCKRGKGVPLENTAIVVFTLRFQLH